MTHDAHNQPLRAALGRVAGTPGDPRDGQETRQESAHTSHNRRAA